MSMGPGWVLGKNHWSKILRHCPFNSEGIQAQLSPNTLSPPLVEWPVSNVQLSCDVLSTRGGGQATTLVSRLI